jgi:hypothetical protein
VILGNNSVPCVLFWLSEQPEASRAAEVLTSRAFAKITEGKSRGSWQNLRFCFSVFPETHEVSGVTEVFSHQTHGQY